MVPVQILFTKMSMLLFRFIFYRFYAHTFDTIIVMINLVISVKGHETTENQESRSAKVT